MIEVVGGKVQTRGWNLDSKIAARGQSKCWQDGRRVCQGGELGCQRFG